MDSVDPTARAKRPPAGRSAGLAKRPNRPDVPEPAVTTVTARQSALLDKVTILRALKSGPVFGLSNLVKRVADAGQHSLDAEFNIQAVAAICELLECGSVACERHGSTVLLALTQQGYQQERELSRWKATPSRPPTRPDKSTILRILKDGPVFGGRTLVKRVAVAGGYLIDRDFRMHVAASVRELRISGAVTCEQHAGTVRLALTRQGARQLQKPDLQPRLGPSWVLGAAGTAALAVGCASIKPDVPRVPLMGYPTPVGMQQIRAEDGQMYFASCKPCAAPSAKTPVLHGRQESTTTPHPEVLQRAAAIKTNSSLKLLTPVNAPILVDAKAPRLASSPKTASRLAGAASEPGLSVHFRPGQATLTSEGKRAIADIARKTQAADQVHVRGATDAQGNVRANEALAKARAAAVRAELLGHGVPKDKILTSYCTGCYVASNDTEAGRQANRRADIGFSELPTAPLGKA